jgi:hypothetical protein
MKLSYALIFYVLITVSLSVLIYVTGLNVIPSILFGMIIGQIVLNVLKPPMEDDLPSSSETALYYTIQIATPIFAIIILFCYMFKDKRTNVTVSIPHYPPE